MCENLPTVSEDDLQLTRRDDLGISCAEGHQQDPQDPSPDGCDLHKDDLTSVSVYHGASAVLSVPDLPHIESLEALQPLQCFSQQALCPQEPGVYALLPQDPHVPAAMTYQASEVTHVQAVTSTVAIQGRAKERKKKCKSAYKHVPHREKPPHLVARRNARERRRVQSVNVAFARLRRVVPGTSGRSKRVSKVKILQGAIDYIYHLQDLLEEDSVPFSNNNCSSLHHESDFGVRSACSLRHSD
ncbi:achaete-scute homolog 1, partial [Penaeus vannamei]|uniref:achaete-scute homolog 1 n=1 Tax=Penaeus vannamei TaxID=6689 RepID=UPI00387F3D48